MNDLGLRNAITYQLPVGDCHPDHTPVRNRHLLCLPDIKESVKIQYSTFQFTQSTCPTKFKDKVTFLQDRIENRYELQEVHVIKT